MHGIQKTIGECIGTASFASVAPDDTVTVAVGQMTRGGLDCVLVIDSERLVGIFTERDFLNRVSAEGRDPRATLMREVMTESPHTLSASVDIAYAINKMAIGGFRNVPIVDERGKPISVLDVRLVMMHLEEVFAGIERDESGDEWIDIGGG